MEKMDRRGMALLAVAHTADDINQSFLPALLPLLIATYGFSLQAAGTLVLAQAIASSVLQPLIGHLSDRFAMPWLIAIGLLGAGLGVGLIGFTGSFTLMFAAALLSGLGVAMFHPEAARYANYVAGERKGTGMRWFSLGGTAGFAIGPLIATFAIAVYGQRGTWLAALPVLLLATLILVDLRRLRSFEPQIVAGTAPSAARDRWGAFALLSLFTCLRSTVYVGIIGFIPIFFVRELGAPIALANLGLTLHVVCGAAGTLTGGALADRVGRKAIMFFSTAGSAVLLAIFAFGAHQLLVAYLVIALAGFILVASNTVLVVVGQEYLPNHMGTASGITLGLAVSIGGIMSPVLGHIGDLYGLPWSFAAAAGLAAISAVIALFFPNDRLARAATTA